MIINREDEWKIEGLEVTAPLDSELYLSLEPLVNDVASREWAGSHIYELEDVVQAIWLHVMENWPEYEKAGEGLVRNMARRAARTYCKQQRIDYMYANGAFIYTPGMVRRYLEETVYCAPENASDLEARADISEAMGHLRWAWAGRPRTRASTSGSSAWPTTQRPGRRWRPTPSRT